jgi:predicted nucleic acid-binding protein
VSAYFFDSSAIVKRYVKENGSAWVIATTDPTSAAHVYLASITGVEVIAALARKRKGNDIIPLVAAAAISQFHDDFSNEYLIIGISDPIIARSMEIADVHALRGYDAVQLGAALEVNGRRMSLGATTPLTLVTGDDELLIAAAAEGLLTDNPNTH